MHLNPARYRSWIRRRPMIYRMYQAVPLQYRAHVRSILGMPTPELGIIPNRRSGVRPTGTSLPYPSGFGHFQAKAYSSSVLIIVPVYGQPDAVERCVNSVIRHTRASYRLLLVDDGSSDSGTRELLSRLSLHSNVNVIRHPRNFGYTHAVNTGLAERRYDEDLLLLNSDTIVTPNWLRKLRQSLRFSPDIGTVTAVSNAAGQFSIDGLPPYSEAIAIIDEYGRDVYSSAVSSEGFHPIETPTANGFCMLIRGEALRDGVAFDSNLFPRGYGEENDFCMHLASRGWRHTIDFRAVVWHHESLSLGEEKASLLQGGMERLAARWPSYQVNVDRFISSTALRSARETASVAVQRAAASAHDASRGSVLFLQHDGAGGARLWMDDLAREMSDRWQPYALIASGRRFFLVTWRDSGWQELEQYELESPIDPRSSDSRDYEDLLAWVLYRLPDIDVAHVSHLLGHHMGAISFLRAAGIPVAMTFHDYYLSCPTAHLLDENGRFCSARCTPTGGECPKQAVHAHVPGLKHGWILNWQEWAVVACRQLTAAVIPDSAVLEVFPEALRSALEGTPVGLRVIPHGRDVGLTGARRFAYHFPDTEPLRLLVLGNIGPHKGGELLEQLTMRRDDIELHILGTVAPQYAGLGHHHGTFDRENLPELVRYVEPDLGIIPSPWPETYSYVLTELWACGLPVVGSKLGAVGRRVVAAGGGIVFDPTSLASLEGAIDDARIRYAELAAAVDSLGEPRRVDAMLRDYESLWQSCVAQSAGVSLPTAYSRSKVVAVET